MNPVGHRAWPAGLALFAAVGASGCGGSSKSHTGGASQDAGGPNAEAAAAAPEDGSARDVLATIDTTTHHQTMVGFGGAIAYYANSLADRQVPGDDVYQVLFADLGLDILRIANWYQNQVETGASDSTPFSDEAAVAVVRNATAALGRLPKILMSSWSPPSYLKSTGDTKDGGTLLRQGPSYAYSQFAQWWMSALGAYAMNGIAPDYISIQNEPDFTASWETCRFDPAEGTNNAGYGKALDAVYSALQDAGLAFQPQLVGPETSGISRNRVQNYLAQTPLGDVMAIAHHLYNGGEGGADPAPDSFGNAMGGLAATAASDAKPILMTEFSPAAPSMFNTAWMIHDSVAVEGVSAYLYWPLIWGPPASPGAVGSGLVTLEDPSSTFTTPKGYTINDVYYAVKHYAKWIDSGWVRVDASSTSFAVKVSAFESPEGANLTVVCLNADAIEHAVTIDPGAFAFTSVAAYRTSGASERTSPVPIGTPALITLPSKSIATVTFGP